MFESWRLITGPFTKMSGARNMAVDEAVLSFLEHTGSVLPSLRVYGWESPTISIGRLQDASPFLGKGLPLVRRITGGRAVLHDMEITYSVVAPSSHPLFSGGINEAYSVISGAIAAALNDIGVGAALSPLKGRREEGKCPACFNSPSRYEVIADGRKLAGSSQRRLRRAFLQHGSILFSVDEEAVAGVFGKKTLERMAWVGAFADAGIEDLKKALIKRMGQCFNADFIPGGLTDSEALLMENLAEMKYSRDEWNLKGAEAVKGAPGGV